MGAVQDGGLVVSVESGGRSAAVAAARGTEVLRRSEMPVSAEALFDWHERPGAFERLTPGFQPAKVVARSGGIRDGARVTLEVPLGPIPTRWEIEHFGYEAGRVFYDRQLRGPFAFWEHEHRVEPQGAESSVLQDRIRYELPVGALGKLVGGAYARGEIERLLEWRHALTRLDLERHAQFASRGPQRVAITGASGFIGGALQPFLTTGGHTVRTIGRGPGNDAPWDPARGEFDTRALDGVDAVIHLAGASIAERWTPERKRAIRESRVKSTRMLAEAMAKMSPRPSVLLSGSAVGIYGSRGNEVLTEDSALGDDFLADVGREWEEATAPAREAGIRVVFLRTGIVLNPAGGALAKMLLPFKAGVGGTLGSGRNWMPWISREDWIGACYHALMTPAVEGPLNLSAPEPVTGATFAATLARVLRRPSLVPVPAFALRTLFGEMAEGTILASQRALPAALEQGGFRFAHPTLPSALRFELGLL